MSRPTGTPGTLQLANTYRAVIDHDGQLWALIGDAWTLMADGTRVWFQPADVPEWVTRCTHEHGPNGSMTCDTLAQCDALAREDERTWGP